MNQELMLKTKLQSGACKQTSDHLLVAISHVVECLYSSL